MNAYAVAYRTRRWRFVPLIRVDMIIEPIRAYDTAYEIALNLDRHGERDVVILSRRRLPGFDPF